ncbi:MAG: DUF3052 family protein [Chloroflexi bacterium]|nr:DUF3052 family protein [Chloroflexota bacterium]
MAEVQGAGYSGTLLVKKLGIKAGMALAILNRPDHYWELLRELPAGLTIDGSPPFDFIHIFTTARAELENELPRLRGQIVQNGMIWVSWPKKAAKVATDVTEDVVREIALAHGLVDVKVAAVDAVWSGLKLVIRVKDRI